MLPFPKLNKKCPKSGILKSAYTVLVPHFHFQVGLRQRKENLKDKHKVTKTSFSVDSPIESYVIIIVAVLFLKNNQSPFHLFNIVDLAVYQKNGRFCVQEFQGLSVSTSPMMLVYLGQENRVEEKIDYSGQ